MNDIREQIQLIEPAKSFEAEYLSMLNEHMRSDEDYYVDDLARKDFDAYIQQLSRESQAIDLLPGVVPMTTYWLIRGHQTILGLSKLRHFLTPALEHHGGHIGYVIRPSQRQKGFGTLILALTLVKARELGLRRIRITCDADNHGSVRIIEKNGGILSGQVISERTGILISQYWIDLTV